MAKLKRKFDDLFGATRYDEILPRSRNTQNDCCKMSMGCTWLSRYSKALEAINTVRKDHQKLCKEKIHELDLLSSCLEQVIGRKMISVIGVWTQTNVCHVYPLDISYWLVIGNFILFSAGLWIGWGTTEQNQKRASPGCSTWKWNTVRLCVNWIVRNFIWRC